MNYDRSDILECRQGNLKAFERLVTRYQQHAIAVAYQMLGDWEDAKEAAQDTFVKVYLSLESFDPSRTFSTWLYRILINTCIDYRRRRSALAETVGITPFRPISEDQSAPDVEFEANEHRALLSKALARLSPKHRAVITLRDLQGLSSREVSDIMDCSEATVRVHLFNARRKLKTLLIPLMNDSDRESR